MRPEFPAHGAIEPYRPGPAGTAPIGKAVVAFQQPVNLLGGADGIEDTWAERRRDAKKENFKDCCSIFRYLMFLLIVSLTIFLNQSQAASRLAAHVKGKVEGTPDVPLDSVVTTDSWFTFMEEALIPNIYEESLDTQLALAESAALPPIDAVNRLLGVVRIRQKRVNEKDFVVTPMFEEYSVACYPPYQNTDQDESSFGPSDKFIYSNDDDGIGYRGQLARYNSGGYIEYLATNKIDALAKVQELKADGFLGPATRAVFVDFTVWSSNWATYAVVTLVFEFGPSGRVTQIAEVLILPSRSVTFGGQGQPMDIFVIILFFSINLFVLWYIYEEGREILENKFDYFKDIWNILDWTNLFLIVAGFAIRVDLWRMADSLDIGAAHMENKDSWINLRNAARNNELVIVLNSCNCLLFWFKIVKYLQHVPIVRGLVAAIFFAAEFLGPFLFMFFIVLIGFALAFNIGFGDKLLELSTFDRSFIYLSRAFVRDVTLIRAYDLAPLFGAMMILVFYVSMLLVVVNTIFAIMADAIMESYHKKPEPDNGLRENQPVEEVWDLIMAKVKPCTDALGRLLSGLFVDDDDSSRSDSKSTSAASSGAGADGGMEPSGLKHLPDRMESKAKSLRFGGAAIEDGRSSRSSYSNDSSLEKRPSKKMLMRAIEHMAGKVISEVSIIGIEIRAELHEITERIAHMQQAVQTLTRRLDDLQHEQQSCIDAGTQAMERFAITNG